MGLNYSKSTNVESMARILGYNWDWEASLTLQVITQHVRKLTCAVRMKRRCGGKKLAQTKMKLIVCFFLSFFLPLLHRQSSAPHSSPVGGCKIKAKRRRKKRRRRRRRKRRRRRRRRRSMCRSLNPAPPPGSALHNQRTQAVYRVALSTVDFNAPDRANLCAGDGPEQTAAMGVKIRVEYWYIYILLRSLWFM